MAQHDYVIANASGATVRADINNMALAISSNNSGSSAPSTTYAYEFWIDTGNSLLKLRNAANNAWITMPLSVTADNTVDVNGGTIDGTNIGASSAGTGAFTTLAASGATDLNSTLAVSGNVSLDGSANELRFYEGANYVGFEAPALTGDQIWVLPAADGSASQVLTTNGSGTLSWATASSGPTFKTFGTSSIMVGDDATGTISAANYNTGLGVDIFAALTSGDANTVLGFSAGKTLNTGQRNVIIGYNAMDAANTGSDSVMIGYEAGGAVVDAVENVAVGYYAGAADMGDYNTFVGASAGQNVTGQKNTFFGARSGDACSSGNNNIGIGYDALGALTTSEDCLAIGTNAGKSTNSPRNMYIGYDAGAAQSGSSDNIAIGYSALVRQTTGANGNIAIGNYAGRAVVDSASTSQLLAIGHYVASDNSAALAGYQNCFVGYNIASASGLAGAFQNTALGMNAMSDLTTGDYNCGIGNHALHAITSGIWNTGIGMDSLNAITTGDYNTCVGKGSGDSLGTSSHNNVCIGSNAKGSSSFNYHLIVIGSGISAANVDNRFSFGKSSNIVHNDFGTNASWTRTSDERKKKNIKEDTLGLDFINDLKTVTFEWKPNCEFPEHFKDYKENPEDNMMETDKVLHGMIAQDVKAALDKAGVDTFGGWTVDPDDGCQELSQEMFVHPLIRAVQELSAKVEELENKLN